MLMGYFTGDDMLNNLGDLMLEKASKIDFPVLLIFGKAQ